MDETDDVNPETIFFNRVFFVTLPPMKLTLFLSCVVIVTLRLRGLNLYPSRVGVIV